MAFGDLWLRETGVPVAAHSIGRGPSLSLRHEFADDPFCFRRSCKSSSRPCVCSNAGWSNGCSCRCRNQSQRIHTAGVAAMIAGCSAFTARHYHCGWRPGRRRIGRRATDASIATDSMLRDALFRRRLQKEDSSAVDEGWRAATAPPDGTADVHCLDRALAQIAKRSGAPAQLAQGLRRVDSRAYYSFLAQHPEVHEEQMRASQKWSEGLPRVLMVAEKPSVARLMAELLLPQGQRLRERSGITGSCRVFEFVAVFPPTGVRSVICITSVIGHLFELTFDGSQAGKAEALYDAPVVKNLTDSARKSRIVDHLQDLARGCDRLCLWLDADREGENIGFEVIAVCREWFPDNERVFRAVFSALTRTELQAAFENLGKPNADIAQSVDARQELDLRVGISFSRLLTRRFVKRRKPSKTSARSKSISYGPCQTPALGFCVARQDEIANFKPVHYWAPMARVQVGGKEFSLQWAFENSSIESEARAVVDAARKTRAATVLSSHRRTERIERPIGLNTVQLLRTASNALGMGPKEAMKVAEDLYSAGYISYPRTETTRYHESYDAGSVLQSHQQQKGWGRAARRAFAECRSAKRRVQSRHSKDVGDHPPITPLRLAAASELRSRERRLYEFVCRHFIASWLGDAQFEALSVELDIGGRKFVSSARVLTAMGWIEAMPWRRKELDLLSRDDPDEGRRIRVFDYILRGDSSMRIGVVDAWLETSHTQPPQPLTEAELVSLMDANGIGTDASIPQHIQTIQDRGYVELRDGAGALIQPQNTFTRRGKSAKQAAKPANGRHLVPTALGLALVHGLSDLDEDLCQPEVRSLIERECAMVASAEMRKEEVLDRNVKLFLGKFGHVQSRLDRLEAFFAPAFRGA